MSFMSWVGRRRWKKSLLLLAFLFASKAGVATAEWSSATKLKSKQLQDYWTQVRTQNLTDSRKKILGDKLVFFLKSLKVDIIRDLRAGNYLDAKKEYKTFGSFVDILVDLGRGDEVNSDYREITATLKSVKRNLKKRKNKDGGPVKGVAILPSGKYVFYAKEKGIPFYLKLNISSKKGQLIFSVNQSGWLLSKKQWEIAKKGKPAAIIKFVEKNIIKKRLGRLSVKPKSS